MLVGLQRIITMLVIKLLLAVGSDRQIDGQTQSHRFIPLHHTVWCLQYLLAERAQHSSGRPTMGYFFSLAVIHCCNCLVINCKNLLSNLAQISHTFCFFSNPFRRPLASVKVPLCMQLPCLMPHNRPKCKCVLPKLRSI